MDARIQTLETPPETGPWQDPPPATELRRQIRALLQAVDSNVKLFDDADLREPTNAQSSPDASVSEQDSFKPSPEGFEAAPGHCSHCQDFGNIIQCNTCPRGLCVERVRGLVACLPIEHLTSPFLCPRCHWVEKQEVPYPFTGDIVGIASAQRDRNPLALHFIRFGQDSTETRDHLTVHLNAAFEGFPNHLHVLDFVTSRLKRGSDRVHAKSIPMIEWFDAHPQRDYLLVIDTHAEADTGELCFALDKEGVPLCSPVNKARKTTAGTPYPVLTAPFPPSFWSTFARLLLLHYPFVRALVEENHFDFVVGFTADTVVPRAINPTLLNFVMSVYVHGRRNSIFDAFVEDFGRFQPSVFTPVVLITPKAARTGKRSVDSPAGGLNFARAQGEITDLTAVSLQYSIPRLRPWGMPVPQCMQGTCAGRSPMDATQHERTASRVKFSCPTCGRRTGYLERPEWIKPSKTSRFAYYHDHPLSEDQATFLQDWVNVNAIEKHSEP
ncbi:hypothetical protein BOTBODRAFT_182337 [Botryobasidium botryosum FD-172 SS1]|uniref:Uncharacterized protein n=1 Tax=Botryobasidium botryosum (strain FD-172 SS1) TaxID=930990 RepID=A0A067LR25_BOTB1|nr:hypothetical protein BOTBODRAFT_182337 [Botryobasidium botryosum FD-172 SS1]